MSCDEPLEKGCKGCCERPGMWMVHESCERIRELENSDINSDRREDEEVNGPGRMTVARRSGFIFCSSATNPSIRRAMSFSASRLESMYPRGTRGRKISSAET